MIEEEVLTAMKTVASKIAKDIEAFKTLRNNSAGKWIVASKSHVYVGYGKGLNGLGFNVRCVLHSSYPEFESKEVAQRYTDPYLIDGANRPIINQPMEASKFYDEEIKVLESCYSELTKVLDKQRGV